uniref:Signal transducer and activator of transcription n=1 Tax=Fundulus heteroclitus TaxID=8078 RepID=A0A3Q2Q4D0_FUNHE
MAQWSEMTILLTGMHENTVTNLYPPNLFPIEARHYLASWIEEQSWDDFSLENTEQEARAKALLGQILQLLQVVSQQNVSNIVEKMKLMQTCRSLVDKPALEFAVMMKNILWKERILIKEYKYKECKTSPEEEAMNQLNEKVAQVQALRKRINTMQEEYNWDKQNFEIKKASLTPNEVTKETKKELESLVMKIKQAQFEMQRLSRERFEVLKDCVDNLARCQEEFFNKLTVWKSEQHKSLIGFPFMDDLSPLQTRAEQLFAVNSNLNQEVSLIPEHIQDIRERLHKLLQLLLQSSFVVERQPPQVIKTQSKFSATVRYLLGEKLAPGKPVQVTADIVNEQQARSMTIEQSENVGELINNTSVMDKNTATRTTNATFRNMSIKKIKRADRKGAESVTEEKFALLFTAKISISTNDAFFVVKIISQPVVVIVHGSQDNNALATIIWDSAFSEPDRLPFVVPDRVPWKMMVETLDNKFCLDVQTNHHLNAFNKHFLAQKIFDRPDYADDFSNMMVSWCQFNKEILAQRNFTFWQWFEGAMDLTKKHLRPYWSDGLIFGFIGKQHIQHVLKQCTDGTFLLRFSDSEIGAITIAYVTYENGMTMFKNLQPFTKRDLEIRCLGDRIRDINDITYLYPNLSKNEAFKKFYTGRPQATNSGYIPVSLQTKVGPELEVPSTDDDNYSIPSLSPPLDDLGLPMEQFGEAMGALQIPDSDSPNGAGFLEPNPPMDYEFFNHLAC